MAHRIRQPLLTVLLAAAMLAQGVGCEGGDKTDEDESSEDESSEDEGSKKKKKSKKKGKGKKKKSKKKGKGKKKGDAAPSASEEALPEGTYARPKPGEVPDLRVGAWSKYKMTTGEITWGVPEKKGTQYLIDAVLRGPIHLTINAWVDVPDEGDSRSSRLVDLKYRMGNGAIQTGTGSGPHAALYKRLIEKTIPTNFEGLPQEDITVAAGTFLGCYKQQTKEEFMGQTTESTVWSHPMVPAPAMVKSVSKDGKTSFELIAFGATGAKKNL